MHPDYQYRVGLAVACEGPGASVVRSSPAGTMRARSGALLDHVRADAEFWFSGMGREMPDGTTSPARILVNPTCKEVLGCLREHRDWLEDQGSRAPKDADWKRQWRGGQVDFAFAGHGTKSGDLVLTDGPLSPEEVVEAVSPRHCPEHWRRRIGVVFDSCYSALSLARMIFHPLHESHVAVVDGFAAALHDEQAWELTDPVGHGVLTYTMRNPGNKHVDDNRLATAIQKQNDAAYVQASLQAFTPCPVTYLTNGRQHSIDFMNGHALDVKGFGTVDITRKLTLTQLTDALELCRSAPTAQLEI